MNAAMRIEFRHEEEKLNYALGIDDERGNEIKETVERLAREHEKVSEVLEKVLELYDEPNELVYAVWNVGYLAGLVVMQREMLKLLQRPQVLVLPVELLPSAIEVDEEDFDDEEGAEFGERPDELSLYL